MNNFCDEVLEMIFSYLDEKDWGRLKRVCKVWNRVLNGFVYTKSDQNLPPLCFTSELLARKLQWYKIVPTTKQNAYIFPKNQTEKMKIGKTGQLIRTPKMTRVSIPSIIDVKWYDNGVVLSHYEFGLCPCTMIMHPLTCDVFLKHETLLLEIDEIQHTVIAKNISHVNGILFCWTIDCIRLWAQFFNHPILLLPDWYE
jgi:hypothetical protein